MQEEFNNSRETDDKRQKEETSRNISQHRDKKRRNKMKGYLAMRLFKEVHSSAELPVKTETENILGTLFVFREYRDALKIAGDERLVCEIETREDLDREIRAKNSKKERSGVKEEGK